MLLEGVGKKEEPTLQVGGNELCWCTAARCLFKAGGGRAKEKRGMGSKCLRQGATSSSSAGKNSIISIGWLPCDATSFVIYTRLKVTVWRRESPWPCSSPQLGCAARPWSLIAAQPHLRPPPRPLQAMRPSCQGCRRIMPPRLPPWTSWPILATSLASREAAGGRFPRRSAAKPSSPARTTAKRRRKVRELRVPLPSQARFGQ